MVNDGRLQPQHLEDLRKSGLSDEQILRCGFRSTGDPVEVARYLNWTSPARSLGPCLVIPFIGADGKSLNYVRVKPDNPRSAKKDRSKRIKYESPVGTANHAYFPPMTREKLADVSIPLVITEGEKKAAKADQEGFACIGLVGVYGFQKARKKEPAGKAQGPREFIPDLAAIPLRGRKVYIACDSDIADKQGVRWAEWHLAELLHQHGANVLAVRIPPGRDGKKQGLDDFLVAHGADALQKLLNDARSPERPEIERQSIDSPDDPHRLAELFLETLQHDGKRTLRYWRSEFHEWRDGAYSAIEEDEIKARLTQFIRKEFCRLNLAELACDVDDSKSMLTRRVTTGLLANVTNALKSICLLPAEMNAPAWLDGMQGPSPLTLISTRSGILDVLALADGKPGYLIPPTPSFFTQNAISFGFDPRAQQPTNWLAFLHQLWPDDPECIATLQEWFGYLLLPDTRQQKILFLLGPKRAGKGTIARILKELVGDRNVAGPTLSALATNFGLAPLIDKNVAMIDDARLSGRSDTAVVLERLLTISGEGIITVDRKFMPSISAKLTTRFVIISNELPRLGDSSGALAGRLILLRFTETFFGREDPFLTDRLSSDLPGILLWALEGWKRLRARGRFLQPASGAEVIEEMEDLSSPVGSFVREECAVDRDACIPVSELYEAYCQWCETHGRKEPGTEQSFGRDLRAVIPHLTKLRRNQGGERWFDYKGVRLLKPGESPKCDSMQSDDCNGSISHLGHHGHIDSQLWCKENKIMEASKMEVVDTMYSHHDHGDQGEISGLSPLEKYRDQLPPH